MMKHVSCSYVRGSQLFSDPITYVNDLRKVNFHTQLRIIILSTVSLEEKQVLVCNSCNSMYISMHHLLNGKLAEMPTIFNGLFTGITNTASTCIRMKGEGD